MFATDEMISTTHSRSLGWEDVHTGELEVHEVLGDHISTVREPNVGTLSDLVASSLRRAQSAHSSLPAEYRLEAGSVD